MKIIKETKKTEIVVHLTKEDIIEYLVKKAMINEKSITKIVFRVPRGGDYSGCDIEIDKDCPIIVFSTYERVQE